MPRASTGERIFIEQYSIIALTSNTAMRFVIPTQETSAVAVVSIYEI
ncbi:MAG: hypothetical protein QM768_19705 [Agriterribacter sp.]